MAPGLIAMLLLGQLVVAQAPAGETSMPTPGGCLPDQSGFLSLRLRGSIEAEIDWRGADLRCTGMARPDGRGLRLRFSGLRPGAGELAIVFAAPGLEMGTSAHGVPVNVTVLDEAGQHIYGTRGDGRCAFDQVDQQPLTGASLPPQSFRVSARGFCTEPARAVDGDGAVLLTRFDFAGIVAFGDLDANPTLDGNSLK